MVGFTQTAPREHRRDRFASKRSTRTSARAQRETGRPCNRMQATHAIRFASGRCPRRRACPRPRGPVAPGGGSTHALRHPPPRWRPDTSSGSAAEQLTDNCRVAGRMANVACRIGAALQQRAFLSSGRHVFSQAQRRARGRCSPCALQAMARTLCVRTGPACCTMAAARVRAGRPAGWQQALSAWRATLRRQSCLTHSGAAEDVPCCALGSLYCRQRTDARPRQRCLQFVATSESRSIATLQLRRVGFAVTSECLACPCGSPSAASWQN